MSFPQVFTIEGNNILTNLTVEYLPIIQQLNCQYRFYNKDYIYCSLPLNIDSILFLYNINHSPDVLKYLPVYQDQTFLIEGKYKPMEHQKLTAAFMTLYKRCYVLSDCRLGKTGSSIMAINWLQDTGIIKGSALIITTLTTVKSVWYNNLITSCPSKDVAIIHGKDGLDYLEKPYHFYVTNYDTIRLNEKDFFKSCKSGRISYILVDELTHCGNITAQRTKAIYKLINKTGVEYAAGLTGTPGTRPEPIFGMCKTINPSKLKWTLKTAWMAALTTPFGIYPGQYTIKPEAKQIIFETMQPAIRYRKEDVLNNLPPIVESLRSCQLLPEQIKAIKELWDYAVTIFKSGESLSAANAAVKLVRILQVAQGITTDGYCIPYPKLTDDRSKVIIDIINETNKKVVIFSMFKKRLTLLKQLMINNKISSDVISGDIRGEKRSKILDDFTNQKDPHVLIAHPTTVGYGTELSVADTLIIDGPLLLGDFSYQQTLERLSSIKQTSNKISIIKVYGDRRELLIFNKLSKGQKENEILANLFEEATNGNI